MTVPATSPAPLESLPRFTSAVRAIETIKPGVPLYLLHPDKFAAAAKIFLDGFPGDVLYAVKANPFLPLLEAMRGLRVQAQAPRGPADRGRLEGRGFQQDAGGRHGDSGDGDG